jgi:hypothetical protein
MIGGPYEEYLDLHVRHSLELDLVHFLCKAKAAKTLMEVADKRIAAHDSQSFGVALEAVLKKECELGFAKGNVFISRLKSLDNIGQYAETLVDVLRLFQECTLQKQEKR